MMFRPTILAGLLLGCAPAALFAQESLPPSMPAADGAAAPQPDDSQDLHEADEDAIVVTGARQTLPGAVIGDIPPELQLGPADIRAYGVSDVTELLAELAPQLGSGQGRGAGAPVVLLNGRRISGFREIRNIPIEAILRVDTLPEEVALRYGYSADQKVVNIVLRRRFRAVTGQIAAGTSTDGGAESGRASLDLLHIRRDNRLNLDIRYQRSAALRESQRDIVPATSGLPFAFAGNVTGLGGPGSEIDPALSALAGTSVTVAGVPNGNPTLADFAARAGIANVSDISRERTLRPLTDQLQVDAVWARPIGRNVSASFNASFEASGRESLNGVPEVTLALPAANPFSPFTREVALARYVDGLTLTQNVGSWTGHAGATFQGTLSGWSWTLTGNFDHAVTNTRTVRGIDYSAYQAALAAGDPSVNPFGELRAGMLGPLLIDRARSVSDTANVQLVTNGTLADLPAGALSTTVKLGAETLAFDTRAVRGGTERSADLNRGNLNGQVSLDLPLTSRRRHFLDAIGDLSANFNFAVNRLSDFGAVTDLGYGLTWKPTGRLTLLWSMSRQEGAPSVQQLGNPVVLTPQVPVFDYETGRTVFVTRIDGGNPDLSADRRHVFKLGLNATVMESPRLNLTADYLRIRTTNAIASLPAATAAIQAAFPDRFIRDEDGELVQVDNRAVNFARERRRQLRWGLNLSVPLRASAAERARLAETMRAAFAERARRRGLQPPGEGERPGFAPPPPDGAALPPGGPGAEAPRGERGRGGPEGGPGRGGFGGFGRGGGFGGFGGPGGRGGFDRREFGAGRLQFSLYHTWIFSNDVLIRPGLPELDLLNGDASGAGGGQPRHQLEARAGVFKGGLGLRLDADWRSATTVRAGPGNPNGDLRFSDLAVANLRLFADLSQVGRLGRESWARGLRISFSVENLFNSRQRVRDAFGNTPLSYQPAYLDPVGREVRLTIRKLFF